MQDLTKRQTEILDLIKQFMALKGYPPTVREICEKTGLSSPATVHSHLANLEDKGYIKKNQSKNRALELMVDNEYSVDINENNHVIQVPLLGKVTAGSPIEAIEMPDEFISLPSHMVPTSKEVFTLTVSGDSMINAGIFDGDIVIVQKQSVARNGDMVVAMTIDNEVTLKTFYKESGYFRLQPENDELEPIIVEEVTILGKAIGLYREF